MDHDHCSYAGCRADVTHAATTWRKDSRGLTTTPAEVRPMCYRHAYRAAVDYPDTTYDLYPVELAR